VRSYVRSRIGPLRATPDSLPNKVRRTLLKDVDGLPAHLDRLLIALEALSAQIADADAELKELMDLWKPWSRGRVFVISDPTMPATSTRKASVPRDYESCLGQ
jgi:hypothetical protein